MVPADIKYGFIKWVYLANIIDHTAYKFFLAIVGQWIWLVGGACCYRLPCPAPYRFSGQLREEVVGGTVTGDGTEFL